jgi:hypothetical protein
VAKTLKTAECIRIAKFRLKAYGRTQVLYKPALSRDAKLLAKIALDSRYDFKRQFLHRKLPSFKYFVMPATERASPL